MSYSFKQLSAFFLCGAFLVASSGQCQMVGFYTQLMRLGDPGIFGQNALSSDEHEVVFTGTYNGASALMKARIPGEPELITTSSAYIGSPSLAADGTLCYISEEQYYPEVVMTNKLFNARMLTDTALPLQDCVCFNYAAIAYIYPEFKTMLVREGMQFNDSRLFNRFEHGAVLGGVTDDLKTQVWSQGFTDGGTITWTLSVLSKSTSTTIAQITGDDVYPSGCRRDSKAFAFVRTSGFVHGFPKREVILRDLEKKSDEVLWKGTGDAEHVTVGKKVVIWFLELPTAKPRTGHGKLVVFDITRHTPIIEYETDQVGGMRKSESSGK
jgi:hypothetical protein